MFDQHKKRGYNISRTCAQCKRREKEVRLCPRRVAERLRVRCAALSLLHSMTLDSLPFVSS